MSVSNELMELLTAALGKSAAPKKLPAATRKKAAPALDEINGIELHDDSESPTVAHAPVPKKKAAAAREPREDTEPKVRKAAPAREPREDTEPKVRKAAPARAPPAAPKEVLAAPKAKRMPVKAMPHSCTCPMCPLKE